MGIGMQASLSSLSQLNSVDFVSIKMLSKVMESDVKSAASLITDLASAPPAGSGEIGGLLDVRA